MTPNGSVLFLVMAVVAVLFPSPHPVPFAAASLCLAYAFIEARHTALLSLVASLKWVAPVCAMLSILWIFIIGTPPTDTLLLNTDTKTTSVAFVVYLSVRLFLISFLIHAVLATPLTRCPLRFISRLSLPAFLKQIAVISLASASSIHAAASRSRTALIASNLITPTVSFRNVQHLWLFLQTIWMFVIGSNTERLETKWLIEDGSGVLSDRLLAKPPLIVRRDMFWLAITLLAILIELYS